MRALTVLALIIALVAACGGAGSGGQTAPAKGTAIPGASGTPDYGY